MIELILNELDCANCANKIEYKVNSLADVKSANLNFVTKTIKIECLNQNSKNKIIQETKRIVKNLEPQVIVEEKISSVEIDMQNKHSNSTKSFISKFTNFTKKYFSLLLGIIIFAVTAVFHFSNTLEIVFYFTAYLLIGGEIVFSAIKNILHGQLFDENFLMAVATIGAFSLGEYNEAVAVMLFYQIGETLQDYAVDNSRKNIKALLNIKPNFANLKTKNGIKTVAPETVTPDDIIIVKPGEKIPLDGIVESGYSMVDTSALTGESVPRKVTVGDELLGGFINQNSTLIIKVTKPYKDSAVAKILDLVENANAKKSPTEKFITKFARYYTPVIVFLALSLAIVPPLLISNASFSDWVRRALIFLVVSCPCALVISIPLGFFGAIGAASKKGILVKGGNYLEALNNVDTIVFDKTGTLTKGVFKVTSIYSTNDFTKNDVLKYAAIAEYYSNHPIAKSISKAYTKELDHNLFSHHEEIPGYGIKVNYNGKLITVGNTKLMEKLKIKYNNPTEAGTIIHVALNSAYVGYIVISDELKYGISTLMNEFKNKGIKKNIMLTGDHKYTANNIAKQLNLDEVRAELLPDQKVAEFEKIKSNSSTKSKIAFVGDGINDAPVLARADVGISMGDLGSDAAIESSDIVLMTDEPSKIIEAIDIAKKTKKIIIQNIVFALGIKFIVLILGAFGIATMWEAVFADVGVALLAILNVTRILKYK